MRFSPLFFVLLLLSFPVAAKDVIPAGHKASYDLTLERTNGGALSVVSATGKMTYSLQRVCNDWKTETVFSLSVAYEISGPETTVWRQTATESDDGCRFDFDVRTLDENGTEIPETKGSARCRGKRKKIAVSFPLASEAGVPKTVLFPVQQTKALLNAALTGKTFLKSYVYDGTKLEALQKTHTVITPTENVPPSTATGDATLLTGKKFRFDTAFYNDLGLAPTNDGTPMYEVSMTLYANGVADNVRQDFGDYAILSRLTKIEPLPAVPCAQKSR